jgi:hypothetical protein
VFENPDNPDPDALMQAEPLPPELQNCLPCPHGVTLEIMEGNARAGLPRAQLQALVQTDALLLDRLQSYASSAAEPGMPVHAASQIVGLLGSNTVQQLALCYSLLDQHAAGSCSGFDYGRYWSQALLESEPKWGQARFDSQRENADLTAVWRRIMRLIIEAHLVDDEGSTERIQLATIDRASTTDPLGMSLAEGKALLASAQQYLVKGQCEGIASDHAHCEHCDARLWHKGWHRRQIRTVFGLVNVQSARVRYCRCAKKPAGASFSPLTLVVPTSMTPELEYLQVKWAAHFSYAAACALLSEVLPTANTISVSAVQRRVRVVGAALERKSSGADLSAAGSQLDREPAQLAVLAIDSAWLNHCHPYPHQGRHVNLVARTGVLRRRENTTLRLCPQPGSVCCYSPGPVLDQLWRGTERQGHHLHRRRWRVRQGSPRCFSADLPHPRLVPHRHEVSGH